MFSKFKKTADLSTGLDQPFKPDDLFRFGIPAPVTALAYDPNQSLLALGTADGTVFVCGQGAVQIILEIDQPSPIRHARIVKGIYLVVVDSMNFVTVWSLDTLEKWGEYRCGNPAASVYADPAMDWLFIGSENGQSMAFDLDRGKISPLRISSIQQQVLPRSRFSPVVGLSLNPRDAAQQLLGYRDLLAVHSLATNEVLFHCAHGLSSNIKFVSWHPSGSHIVSYHEDGKLTFYDGKTGKLLNTRDTHVLDGSFLAWCCTEDPDTTFLVLGSTELYLINFGKSPTYNITSYDAMGKFFGNAPDKLVQLPEKISAALPLARGSPHHNFYNPEWIVVCYVSGGSDVYSLPGLQVKRNNSYILPPALSFSAAQRTFMGSTSMSRTQWLGIMAVSPKTVLRGGVPSRQRLRRLPVCTVLIVGGKDGSVRLFDGSRSEPNDFRVVDVSIADIVPNADISVSGVSFAGSTGELTISAGTDVYLFRFGRNRSAYTDFIPTGDVIQDISQRCATHIQQGFLPQYLIPGQARVSMVHNSNVGFVVIGYEDGRLLVVDRRGPAIIYNEVIGEVPTCAEFGIEIVGQKDYSAIVLAVGTKAGNVHVFEVLPRQGGGFIPTKYDVWNVGSDPVIHISHIDLVRGAPAAAMPEVLQELARSIQIEGAVLAVTSRDARIFHVGSKRPKLAHKRFSTPLISASFAFLRQGDSLALLTLNELGNTGVYSIPGLSKLSDAHVPYKCSGKDSIITGVGDAVIQIEEKYAGLMHVWGTGQQPIVSQVYNPLIKTSARPTITAVQWVSGRQYVSIEDLDRIIGGSRRGKTRRAGVDLVENATSESAAPTLEPAGYVRPQRATATYQEGGSSKTWGQTFDDYYDSAGQAVGGLADDFQDMVMSAKKDATSSITKSIIRKKMGF